MHIYIYTYVHTYVSSTTCIYDKQILVTQLFFVGPNSQALSAGLQGNEAVTELDLSGQSFSHRTAELVEDAEAKETWGVSAYVFLGTYFQTVGE